MPSGARSARKSTLPSGRRVAVTTAVLASAAGISTSCDATPPTDALITSVPPRDTVANSTGEPPRGDHTATVGVVMPGAKSVTGTRGESVTRTAVEGGATTTGGGGGASTTGGGGGGAPYEGR